MAARRKSRSEQEANEWTQEEDIEKAKKQDEETLKDMKSIIVKPLKQDIVQVPIHGRAIIVHRWSEKAKGEIKSRQGGKKRGPKETLPPRIPKEEYEAAMYRLPDGGHGFPAIAFKQAAVSACRYVDGFNMTTARGLFWMFGEGEGDLMRLKSNKPFMREDMVRIGQGFKKTATARYRPQYNNWTGTLWVRFLPELIEFEQILGLLNIGGVCVGVGELRIEKGYNYGGFELANTARKRGTKAA